MIMDTIKQNFVFKSLGLRGDTLEEVITLDCPIFKEEIYTVPINGNKFTFKKTVNEQLIDWLDDQDKSDLMYNNDWHCIIDYWVEEPKVIDKILVIELANNYLTPLEHGERLLVDFLVVYGRVHDKIKDLSPTNQFSVVLETLGIGYDAQGEAYRSMTVLLRDELNEVKPLTLGYNDEKDK
jgi:hypothetical protein